MRADGFVSDIEILASIRANLWQSLYLIDGEAGDGKHPGSIGFTVD